MAVMAKRKILVVEDNDLNRSLLCEILKPEYDVVEAENGREALERLREIGCECVQGYYFAKPMPVKEFELHLKKSGMGGR